MNLKCIFFVKFTAELVSFLNAFIQCATCIKEQMYKRFLFKNKTKNPLSF
uniref:Uncharacterized protein n=1 Tax=Anguilla anguilla TaxID=7936 RepID=A0A0E9UY72_ANGAN